MKPPQTFRELVVRYASGERDFSGSELDGDPDDDLSNAGLDGVDLSQSFLIARLRGASLRNARFVAANVKGSDFGGADLTGADFTGAALSGTSFRGAKLDGTRFAGAVYYSLVLQADDRPDW